MSINAFDYVQAVDRGPIFSYVCPDGKNFHIAVELMRRHKVPGLEFTINTSKLAFQKYILENVVSMKRIFELAKRDHRTLGPILLCEAPQGYTWELGLPDLQTSASLADGHHRFCLATMRKWDRVEAIFYPYEIWKNFEVSGIPSLTSEELKASPVTQRSY